MLKDEEIELKKIVWAYMLENGRITSGNWNYYGGWYELPEEARKLSWNKQDKWIEEVHEKIKSIGVDWEKTGVPEFENHSAFTDTFSDPAEKECMLGVIHLNNGERLSIGTSEIESYVSNAINALNTKNNLIQEDLVKKWFE